MFKTLLVGLDGSPDSEAAIPARARELSDQGIDTKVERDASILGGPAQVLEAIAERVRAELIVVGRKGRSQIVAIAVGSVIDRLLHLSERCVLAVPPPEPK